MGENVKNKMAIPRYQQIAVEIASKIVREEYQVGDRIYARSSLASEYGVSSETARRAMCVLRDLGIVASEKGSGVTIISYQEAVEFIRRNEKRKSIDMIKEQLVESIGRQQKEIKTLNACLNDLIFTSEHFRTMNPFMPFEIQITSQCSCLNKMISEIQFWQNTGATIIAIRRKDTVFKSPGPYMPLLEDDIVYFLPQDDTSQRVEEFLYSFKKEITYME